MRVQQIFDSGELIHPEYQTTLQSIAADCQEFIHESGGYPIFKALPSTYDDLQKVKVRKHRQKTRFSETFNEAFEHEIKDLRQRAVFTNSQVIEEVDDDRNLFYVFPRNGYRFMYCTEVTHSTKDYQQVFDSLFEQFENEKAEQLIHDLLKFTYTRENLIEGIEKQVEIIFYNVPYYYAARANMFEYDDLLTDLTQLGDS